MSASAQTLRELQFSAGDFLEVQLRDWATSRFNVEEICTYAVQGNVECRSSACNLYIRAALRGTSIWPPGTLALARIEFEERRKGHGTSLLKFLVDLAPEIQCVNLGLEMTIDDPGIQSFARRFFKPWPEEFRDGNNWLISIGDLSSRLLE